MNKRKWIYCEYVCETNMGRYSGHCPVCLSEEDSVYTQIKKRLYNIEVNFKYEKIISFNFSFFER